jgi:hypothetical protein
MLVLFGLIVRFLFFYSEVEVYWISPRLMLELFLGGFDMGDRGWEWWSWWRGWNGKEELVVGLSIW